MAAYCRAHWVSLECIASVWNMQYVASVWHWSSVGCFCMSRLSICGLYDLNNFVCTGLSSLNTAQIACWSDLKTALRPCGWSCSRHSERELRKLSEAHRRYPSNPNACSSNTVNKSSRLCRESVSLFCCSFACPQPIIMNVWIECFLSCEWLFLFKLCLSVFVCHF